jgi:hypothetical protein
MDILLVNLIIQQHETKFWSVYYDLWKFHAVAFSSKEVIWFLKCKPIKRSLHVDIVIMNSIFKPCWFWGLHSDDYEKSQNRALLIACFLLGLVFDLEDYIPPKSRWISSELHGVASLKILLFIFKPSLIQKHSKLSSHNSLVGPVVPYGNEAWMDRKADGKRLSASALKFMKRT